MKKLSKNEIKTLFSKIEINLETGEVPFMDNFRAYKEKHEWVELRLLDFLEFLVFHQELYREFYKYGEIDFQSHLNEKCPISNEEQEDEVDEEVGDGK